MRQHDHSGSLRADHDRRALSRVREGEVERVRIEEGERDGVSDTVRKFLTLTIFYGSGVALVWWGSSWKAALGVFILLWAANIEDRFSHY